MRQQTINRPECSPVAVKKIAAKELFGIFILTLALFLPLSAKAHKISLFAWPESNKVYAQGYFAKNRPAMNADVTAFNREGQQLASGKTDENGLWYFAQPDEKFVLLRINSGDGHKAEFLLNLPAAEKSKASLTPQNLEPEKNAAAPKPDFKQLIPQIASHTSKSEQHPNPAASDSNQLESQKILQELLREVSALQHSVAELQQDLRQQNETSPKDIFAGLGWIAGLMALLWFIKTRTRKS